jgi:CBS domain-containing protein
MTAKDLMQTIVVTCRESDSAGYVCDMFQREHVHGAPVVDESENLVGIVSIEDILIGSMSWSEPGSSEAADDREADETGLDKTVVRDIMTSPAITATEETPVADVAMMMWRFRIHHVPIVRGGKIAGMVSSLDICRALAYGQVDG